MSRFYAFFEQILTVVQRQLLFHLNDNYYSLFIINKQGLTEGARRATGVNPCCALKLHLSNNSFHPSIRLMFFALDCSNL